MIQHFKNFSDKDNHLRELMDVIDGWPVSDEKLDNMSFEAGRNAKALLVCSPAQFEKAKRVLVRYCYRFGLNKSALRQVSLSTLHPAAHSLTLPSLPHPAGGQPQIWKLCISD